jgi:GT2 family glycosyltransferase
MQRNNQIKNFLEDDKYTHLFLLDSDCVPEQLCVEKLLDYDLDIVASVAGALINGNHCLTAATLIKEDEVIDGKRYLFPPVKSEEERGLMEVDAVGMTGVLIKRHVFEKIEPPYFEVLYKDNGTQTDLGEDYYFSRKCKEAGFKIYADFSLRQRHFKTVAL